VLVRREKKMFKLVSEDRQRKSAVLQIVRKSVPSGKLGLGGVAFRDSEARADMVPYVTT